MKIRRLRYMSGMSAALTFPAASGEVLRTKTKVDHRTSEEAALIRRVQAQDELAFREIVDRYQSKDFSISSFDFRSSLLTWIYKITVNECYDYLRKKRVRKLVYESDFSGEESLQIENSEPVSGQNPSIAERLAQHDLIFKLLSKISPEDRSLILLKEVEGHSVEELSEMTGMNEN